MGGHDDPQVARISDDSGAGGAPAFYKNWGETLVSADLVDVSSLIDRSKIGRLQWIAITLCGLVAILDGFDNQSIAFVAPLIAKELHVAMPDFGPIFGSGLFGLMAGTIICGPLADRIGRRPVIILSVIVFGLLTLLIPFATSVRDLVLLRFFAGIGLGGALPNIIALTSEYAPKTKRATLVSLMFCGIPVGAVIGGLLSVQLMGSFGWRGVFYAGGILPLLLVLFLVLMLPESLRFLVAKGEAPSRVLALLRRLDPGTRYDDDVRCLLPKQRAEGFPVSHLFTGGRTIVTLLLWLTFFCTLVVVAFLVSWLPSVLRQMNTSMELAATATVVLNAGAVVGGLLLGRMTDTVMSYRFVTVAYISGAIVTGLLGFAMHAQIAVFMINVFAAGMVIPGLQFCMIAIVAAYYPTELRSTGVGWALGAGRMGSGCGPIAGGALIGWGLSTEELFLVASVPTICAAIAVSLISFRIRPGALSN